MTPPVASGAPGATQRVLAWTAAGVAVAGFGLSLVAWRLREDVVSGYEARLCPEGEASEMDVSRCREPQATARERVDQWEAVTALAWRSPPREGRCRSVRPELTGIGAAPHRAANEAQERSPSGLSPAMISRLALMTGPTPCMDIGAGIEDLGPRGRDM